MKMAPTAANAERQRRPAAASAVAAAKALVAMLVVLALLLTEADAMAPTRKRRLPTGAVQSNKGPSEIDVGELPYVRGPQ